MAAILDMIDQFRSSFNSICKYLNEIWDVETFQERLLHEENIFNPTKFYNLHSICINKLDKFCELVESSVGELEYSRKVASGWTDNSSIPENKFSNMSINEDKSSGIINYKEIMQKNCQRVTKLYFEHNEIFFKRQREGDHIIPKLPILKETKIHKENIKIDEVIDNWLLEAKKRPYKVDIEKIEFDSIGRVTGLLVSIDNLLKAGIILKYDDINEPLSPFSLVRIAVFGYHEKKTIRESSDTIEFQRITQIGLNLLNDFDPKNSLTKLLDWISSYHDLYTAKCKKCEKILSHESYSYKYLPSKTIRESSDTIEFQRITQIGLNLLNDFDPKNSLTKLLDWISSYHDLYTAKCKKCEKILSHESYSYKYLPSVLRILIDDNFVPFHWNCYNYS
ncbi:hypothetical protein Glove_54g8 [Diversispora epigaea]|uniref:Mediator of RNA polymerase II transcription subunit 27 n=1 Tax=Diversispora epigaea TaxID=1348612 RepID=A0A397JCS3_9GLOM|nr:hypothetical protein Glove_54g8 [Diversispora epigaea]